MNVSVIFAERSVTTAAVAAAASVPSSLTSTKALWTTFDRNRSLAGDMPVSREERESVAYSCTLKTFLGYFGGLIALIFVSLAVLVIDNVFI